MNKTNSFTAINFRIDSVTLERIELLVKKHNGITRSDVLRECIETSLDVVEKKLDVMKKYDEAVSDKLLDGKQDFDEEKFLKKLLKQQKNK